jgi:hypothetical protein
MSSKLKILFLIAIIFTNVITETKQCFSTSKTENRDLIKNVEAKKENSSQDFQNELKMPENLGHIW